MAAASVLHALAKRACASVSHVHAEWRAAGPRANRRASFARAIAVIRNRMIARDADAGADVLVRLTWNSLHLLDSTHRPLDWQRLFRRAQRDGTLDMPVVVSKSRGRFTPLPLRLVMLRKPPQAAMKARAARRQNQKIAATASIRSRWRRRAVSAALAGGTGVQAAEVAAAHGRAAAKHPDLARAWLYAHLLFALLVEEAVAELRMSKGLLSECDGRQVSLWRCFQLAATALLNAIMPRAHSPHSCGSCDLGGCMSRSENANWTRGVLKLAPMVNRQRCPRSRRYPPQHRAWPLVPQSGKLHCSTTG